MKSAKPQVTQTTLDPSTTRYRDEIFDRARDVSNQQYTPYNGQTVANANPLSYQGVNGMQQAQGLLQMVGDRALGANERALQSSQDFNNQASQYGRIANETGGMAGQFDQYGRQMNNWQQGADTRASGLDNFGQQFQDYANSGRTGALALGGDQAATDRLMNPYQQQVLDAVSADFDRQRAHAHTDANQAATAAGAFGGSRHGVMEGERLGQIDAAQLGTMANLRQTGFNDAMGRAGQAANLGFGAGNMSLAGVNAAHGERGLGLQAQQVGQGFNRLGMDMRNLGLGYDQMGLQSRGMGLQAQQLGLGALGQAQGAAQGQAGIAGQMFGAGDYFRNVNQAGLDDQYRQFLEQRDWGLRGLDVLKGGMSGLPYGQTQTTPQQRNAASGILGGAATGAGIGSAIPGLGTALGAGIGGILGIFG